MSISITKSKPGVLKPDLVRDIRIKSNNVKKKALATQPESSGVSLTTEPHNYSQKTGYTPLIGASFKGGFNSMEQVRDNLLSKVTTSSPNSYSLLNVKAQKALTTQIKKAVINVGVPPAEAQELVTFMCLVLDIYTALSHLSTAAQAASAILESFSKNTVAVENTDASSANTHANSIISAFKAELEAKAKAKKMGAILCAVYAFACAALTVLAAVSFVAGQGELTAMLALAAIQMGFQSAVEGEISQGETPPYWLTMMGQYGVFGAILFPIPNHQTAQDIGLGINAAMILINFFDGVGEIDAIVEGTDEAAEAGDDAAEAGSNASDAAVPTKKASNLTRALVGIDTALQLLGDVAQIIQIVMQISGKGSSKKEKEALAYLSLTSGGVVGSGVEGAAMALNNRFDSNPETQQIIDAILTGIAPLIGMGVHAVEKKMLISSARNAEPTNDSKRIKLLADLSRFTKKAKGGMNEILQVLQVLMGVGNLSASGNQIGESIVQKYVLEEQEQVELATLLDSNSSKVNSKIIEFFDQYEQQLNAAVEALVKDFTGATKSIEAILADDYLHTN